MLSLDIRKYVIPTSLVMCNIWSTEAEILVHGTGMVETGYDYLSQIDCNNGGKGFYQMEALDYNDIVKYLKRPENKVLLNSINSCCYLDMLPLDPNSLIYNLRLAVLMCRVHYLRVSQPLPDKTDAKGFARYHKNFYNTALGAADPDKNTEIFQKVIDGKV